MAAIAIKSRDYETMAVYKRNIATMNGVEKLCATCLSSDRNLYPVDKISTQLTYDFRLLPQDRVCWECRAQMIKFVQFRTKANDARKTIKMIINGQMDFKAVKPLSSLGMKTMGPVSRSFWESQVTPEYKLAEFMNVDQEPRLVEIKEDPLDIKTEFALEEPYEEPLHIFEAESEQFYQPTINNERDSFTYDADLTERDSESTDSCRSNLALSNLLIDKTATTVVKNETGFDVEDNLMTKYTILKVNKNQASEKTYKHQPTRSQISSTLVPSILQSHLRTNPVTQSIPYTVPISVSQLNPQLVPLSNDATDRYSNKLGKMQSAVSLANPKLSLLLEVPPLLPKLVPKPGLFMPSKGPSVPSDPGPSNIPDSGFYLETMVYPDGTKIVREVRSETKIDAYYSKKCSEEELAKQRQELREHIVYKSCPYKCETCIEYFSCSEKLQKHNENYHKPGYSFVCPTCAQRYPDKDKLDQHKQLHYWNYVCSQCNFTRHRQNRVEAHYKTVHRRTDIDCSICGQVFPTFAKFKQHRNSKHRTKVHNCHLCAATFMTAFNLSIHLETHEEPDKPAEFKCIFCPKEFRGYKLFCLHVKKHEKKLAEEPRVCTLCNKFYKTFSGYKQHMKAVHEPDQKKDPKFECDCCGAKFFGRTQIREHIEMLHCPEPKYPCGECRRTFQTVKKLQSHVRNVHRKSTKFRPLCDLCGKDFENRSALDQHKNSHLGLRPYICPFCDSDFSFSGALYTHTKLKHKRKLPPLPEREKLVQARLAMKKQVESEFAEKKRQENPDFDIKSYLESAKRKRKNTETSASKKAVTKRSRIEKLY